MCYCPTPTLHLNLALTGDGAFLLSPQKTYSVWFISILNYGDTENVLINHLLLVIPMSYPCHYTNLCPHKPHKHAHTHTHTHWETVEEYTIQETLHRTMTLSKLPSKVSLVLGKARSRRAPSLGCWGLSHLDDVLPKNSAPDVMHAWAAHCRDEAAPVAHSCSCFTLIASLLRERERGERERERER